MTAPGIVLDALAFAIGNFRLGPLDVTLGAGEVLVMLGPNGCGKSVTLETIAGFHRPDAGRVLIRGRDVTALPPERRNVGFMVQNFGLFPHLTVAQNVAVAMRGSVSPAPLAGLPHGDVGALLGHFGVARLSTRMPQDLSPGEKQRVALARALAAAPDVFLFDEPFSALDAHTRDTLREELLSFLRGISIPAIFVTHDHTDAMTLADKTVVLRDGAIVQSGTPADIFEKPANAFVAGFVGVENILSGRLEHGHDGSRSLAIGGQALQVATSSSALQTPCDVTAAIRADAVSLYPAERAPPVPPGANRLAARIMRVSSVGPLATIGLNCGFPLKAYLLTREARALDLAPEREVVAHIPAEAIHLMAD
jgi:molybdate/tungstate transport system ATP-binding protein